MELDFLQSLLLLHEWGGFHHSCRLYILQRLSVIERRDNNVMDTNHMSSNKDDPSLDIVVETRPKTKRPPLYKVLLLNDDYTPMEFVVIVLERFFGMNHSQAFEIMLTVHKKGLAVVGVFSHEIAETKVSQVMDFSRKHQHPLVCTMEKE